MADEKAVKLMSAMTYRYDRRATEKMYKYVVKHLPVSLLKALRAKKIRNYTEL